MKIFALETNEKKLADSCLSSNESVTLTVRFHGFLFFMRFLRALLATVIIGAVGVLLWMITIPPVIVYAVSAIIWLIGVFFPLVVAFIDWKFDILFLTSEKLVIVNQTSIIKQEMRQMNLDNIASVSASTQFWNILPFGALSFDLKEGTGQKLDLKYVPHAAKVASIISDAVTLFQRRRAAMAARGGEEGS